MSDIIKIFALGGLDEDGKNMYVVEINDDIFVLDAGMKYPEKSMPGIDVIIPDYTYLIKNKGRIKAYIISHGHDDYMGSLSYVLKDAPAPVYCSKVTSEMIKDTARKLRNDVDIDFNIVETTSEVKIANRKVNFFSTTHSVAQSMGVAIYTSQGYIVYTGDFIIDSGAFQRFRTDIRALSKISDHPVLCLMSESKGALKGDFASPKHKLTPFIERQFEEHKGRIVISTYTQNLFAIQEIINLSIKKNKKILVFSKDMQKLISSFKTPGLLEIPVGNLATLADLKKEDQSDLVVLVTGNGEKLFRVLQRIANNELIEECGFTFEEEDLIVIAAQSNPGTEVIAVKTLDELHRTGASILNVTRRMISSMHAQEEDLKLVISILQPKYYLPISGYYRQLLANATVASSMDIGLNHKNILVYDNGMVAKFENRNYKSGEPLVQTGELMVDGLGMFDAGSVVINDRNKLSEDGVIILGVGVDYNTKEIIAGPDIQTRGLIFVKDSDDLLKGIEKLYREVVVETFKDRKLNYTEKRQIIRDKISKYVKKETGKDPMILSMIVEI